MSVTEDFRAAVAAAEQDPALALAGPYMVASRLAFAAARVLGAPAAGLSVSSRDQLVRVPLGASHPDAATAERLQFTAGEGPCLDAYGGQDAIMASAKVMAACWPMFDRELHAQTPFRSVFAAPLPGIGALDVYFTDPTGCHTVDIADASVVIQQIQFALTDTDLPTALARRAPQSHQGRRAQVPIAMGVLMVELEVTALDALSILRARALVTDQVIEDLADDVITGAVAPGHFTS